MKVGFRKPSVKRSIKARTTGKIKRRVKGTINPLYGKRGIGFITNPVKAACGWIYRRVTFGVRDLFRFIARIFKG